MREHLNRFLPSSVNCWSSETELDVSDSNILYGRELYETEGFKIVSSLLT